MWRRSTMPSRSLSSRRLSVRSLRLLLDNLDHQNIAVDRLTVNEPDLDDVYFALTGHATHEKEPVR